MITYLNISLFDSPAQTLVNTVNTVGIMGKGIALVFKKLYPDMFDKYRTLCLANKFDVGMLYVYRTPHKIIVNFPTKKHWRNPSQVDFIEAGLKKFVERYQDYGISSVSFPQLGCGNGELNWEQQVQPLMERYLQKLPIPVYIHLYSQAPDFVPERLDRKWAKQMQLEHEQISANQLWMDLHKLVHSTGEPSYSLNPSTQVAIDDEHLCFSFHTQRAIVHRQDVEDLWSILLQRGAIRENDFPQPIREASANVHLFDLLRRLAYIKPLTLSTKTAQGLVAYQGLQYAPPPSQDVFLETEVSV
ncbi:MAG TPA: macro domain-containing protein [Herpetosiphonaceae bacterium]|nr:macro domain-containing protein [Herpetosiphonaceae bacterium]